MAWDVVSQLKGPQGPAGSDANVDAHEGAVDPHPQYATDSDLSTGLAGKAATSHTHDGGAITTGTVPFARLPVGSSGTQVASGAHSHAGVYATTSHTHDPVTLVGSDDAYARYNSTSGQSIPNSVDTFCSFDTTAASHTWVTRTASGAGHYFTVGVAGIWAVTATIRYQGGAAGECYGALVSSNYGSQQVITAGGGYSNGTAYTINLAYVGLFAAGDYVLTQVWQNTGGARTLEAGSGWRNINLALIRRS